MVESVECSAVSKSLKTIKPRCFNVVGCSTRRVWFHKGCIIAESVLSLSRVGLTARSQSRNWATLALARTLAAGSSLPLVVVPA
ncbi:hypothetical protein CF120_02535 [Aeromonas allosaccharophila]|nr:hypothetical protein CF120_02535 [Aeromonas allosaccharophila]